MTVEQKRRALFDAFAIKEASATSQSHIDFVLKRYSSGDYVEAWVDMSWIAFNAALDAVEIELPPFMEVPDEDECDGYEEFEAMEATACTANAMRHACRAAIESTGLGLKVKP